jgi:hypothetical protein
MWPSVSSSFNFFRQISSVMTRMSTLSHGNDFRICGKHFYNYLGSQQNKIQFWKYYKRCTYHAETYCCMLAAAGYDYEQIW